jgi:hypothetical protein
MRTLVPPDPPRSDCDLEERRQVVENRYLVHCNNVSSIIEAAVRDGASEDYIVRMAGVYLTIAGADDGPPD